MSGVLTDSRVGDGLFSLVSVLLQCHTHGLSMEVSGHTWYHKLLKPLKSLLKPTVFSWLSIPHDSGAPSLFLRLLLLPF